MTRDPGMEGGELDTIDAWVTQAGLAGAPEGDLLRGFCKRLRDAGLPVARALIVIDTLHPVHEGRVFRWRSDQAAETEMREYGRTTVDGETAANWQRSPFYGMVQTGRSAFRKRLSDDEEPEYPIFEELREDGQTDYLALIQRFAETRVIGEMDCIYSSWTTDEEGGFAERHLAALKRLVPSLALAVKAESLGRILNTLVETYLGRDAGRRVLAGKIERGRADRIEAALWFSDLRGYTRISGAAKPDEILPFLNDYAEAVISSVHDAGGDVLKLIGDGTLAIFTAADRAEACGCALKAAALAKDRIGALNERRREANLPATDAYLGLHVGEVFYGNIGSADRLDFTVVGPAVNEVSRIAAMCRSTERNLLVSSAFAAVLRDDERARLVSVGRYALRGVDHPQELFTPDWTANR